MILRGRQRDMVQSVSTRVAPVFPVSDLDAAMACYRGLRFGVRQWRGGGYGFVTVIRFGSPVNAAS
jgi:hypothetical protein